MWNWEIYTIKVTKRGDLIFISKTSALCDLIAFT